MQQPSSDPFVARPNPVGQAYNTIIRRIESPREIEYRVFAQVTAALQEAADPKTYFTKRIQATHRNRELWQTLACDLADDNNKLPEALRAQLISLAIWVTRETTRVNLNNTSLKDLIEINLSIMQGLQPAAHKVA